MRVFEEVVMHWNQEASLNRGALLWNNKIRVKTWKSEKPSCLAAVVNAHAACCPGCEYAPQGHLKSTALRSVNVPRTELEITCSTTWKAFFHLGFPQMAHKAYGFGLVWVVCGQRQADICIKKRKIFSI